MEAAELERILRDRFGPYAWLYETGSFAGAGGIVRTYLGLGAGTPLPFVFPHGVDTGENLEPEDVAGAEPVYVAVREDIAVAAATVKPVLHFPHPWLLLPPASTTTGEGAGTLFIGTPSGPENNENLFRAIQRLALPRPWGIMLKFRGLDPGDFDWWRDRGFVTHTAGPAVSTDFYPNQRAALAGYATIAVSYLSSIAVFAALMGKRIALVPGVAQQFVTIPDSEFVMHDMTKSVHAIWAMLLSDDRAVRIAEAERLLGAPFLDTPERLRRRMADALAATPGEFYLPALPKQVGHGAARALLRRRLAIHKFLPNPARALAGKLAWHLGLSRVGIISGDELAHFGLTEGVPYTFFTCRSREVGRRIGLGEGPKKPVRAKP